ncbi:hypothetical protein [Paraglaciecola hydrolytica]|uniref:Uncharacterized protein n=1 Tax=Paraglaciecola hydrolytica TaxID=1799789 RepID=A0A136A068_9ALTE|nr:hypothetical protein [Paraglaciecola hydrolytica]KXI28649.1 hypothetical protein AX660_16345 [Paraglaciecola hydrolytica]
MVVAKEIYPFESANSGLWTGEVIGVDRPFKSLNISLSKWSFKQGKHSASLLLTTFLDSSEFDIIGKVNCQFSLQQQDLNAKKSYLSFIPSLMPNKGKNKKAIAANEVCTKIGVNRIEFFAVSSANVGVEISFAQYPTVKALIAISQGRPIALGASYVNLENAIKFGWLSAKEVKLLPNGVFKKGLPGIWVGEFTPENTGSSNLSSGNVIGLTFNAGRLSGSITLVVDGKNCIYAVDKLEGSTNTTFSISVVAAERTSCPSITIKQITFEAISANQISVTVLTQNGTDYKALFFGQGEGRLPFQEADVSSQRNEPSPSNKKVVKKVTSPHLRDNPDYEEDIWQLTNWVALDINNRNKKLYSKPYLLTVALPFGALGLELTVSDMLTGAIFQFKGHCSPWMVVNFLGFHGITANRADDVSALLIREQTQFYTTNKLSEFTAFVKPLNVMVKALNLACRAANIEAIRIEVPKAKIAPIEKAQQEAYHRATRTAYGTLSRKNQWVFQDGYHGHAEPTTFRAKINLRNDYIDFETESVCKPEPHFNLEISHRLLLDIPFSAISEITTHLSHQYSLYCPETQQISFRFTGVPTGYTCQDLECIAITQKSNNWQADLSAFITHEEAARRKQIAYENARKVDSDSVKARIELLSKTELEIEFLDHPQVLSNSQKRYFMVNKSGRLTHLAQRPGETNYVSILHVRSQWDWDAGLTPGVEMGVVKIEKNQLASYQYIREHPPGVSPFYQSCRLPQINPFPFTFEYQNVIQDGKSVKDMWELTTARPYCSVVGMKPGECEISVCRNEQTKPLKTYLFIDELKAQRFALEIRSKQTGPSSYAEDKARIRKANLNMGKSKHAEFEADPMCGPVRCSKAEELQFLLDQYYQ